MRLVEESGALRVGHTGLEPGAEPRASRRGPRQAYYSLLTRPVPCALAWLRQASLETAHRLSEEKLNGEIRLRSELQMEVKSLVMVS